MALKLVFRPGAAHDLVGIIQYIAHAADLPTAKRFHDRLQLSCERLIQAPGMGAPYLRRPGVRKINEGPYKIFYRVAETEIVILRLWDGRRGTAPTF